MTIEKLADLVAPLSVEAFRAVLRERRLLHVPGAGANRYAALLPWDTLIDLVTSGAYPAEKLRMTRETRLLPPSLYRDGDAPRGDVIRGIMATRGSIVTRGLEQHYPPLGRLVTRMMHELGEKVLVASTTTVGTSGATLPHIDKADAIAVQVEGAKQWFIYRDPETDPVPGMRERPRETEPQLLMELTLEAGDMLIVPGGYFHRCETPAGRSHHVTFFVYPMTAPRILDLLFREMAEDPAQRAPIRFAADDARAQEALRERIVRRVRELPYEELLERHFATDHSPGRHEDW